MSVALLDVNVLVALLDPAHPNHEDAHYWFGRARKSGWATCPITINGCIRVLSNPVYPTVEAAPADVISHLRVLCSGPGNYFWNDSVSLLESSLIHPERIITHQAITDTYLLALAVSNRGKLATFDRGIPLKAVIGAGADHLDLIGIARRPQ